MTRLARQRAPGAGVVCAAAENLPFAVGAFSALAMSVVFSFLTDPVRVLREFRRVLRAARPPRSTRPVPSCAGPLPRRSRGHFYPDAALAALASQAGLQEVRVRNDGGGQLLTARA
jgi:SAM-dependent methyltransferase